MQTTKRIMAMTLAFILALGLFSTQPLVQAASKELTSC